VTRAGTPLLALALLPGVASATTFDHSSFDALLRKHVVQGMVDYDGFATAPEFAAYLDSLWAADLSRLDHQEQLALWINAYNAYTIHLVNVFKQRDSIRKINRLLGFIKTRGPWHEPIAKVAGKTWHLDNVERDIIGKQFDEPRVHFALVYAAMSAPPLRSEAYTGSRLDEQLEDQAKKFLLESPDKNRVDVRNSVVYASMIFEWHKRDFGTEDNAIGRFMAKFHPPGPAKRLLESGSFLLEKMDFDWTLNSQEKARARGR
jgi:hypothetical protein